MSDVTRLLHWIEAGDPKAAEELLPLVYDELRRLAAAKMAREQPGQTLQATALVHEAYLRLVHQPPSPPAEEGDKGEVGWDGRGHFFAAAAEAMRRILIDAARRRASDKRGGRVNRVELPDVPRSAATDPCDLLALDEALQRLEAEHPDKARLIKLRFFAGLTLDEAAAATGLSRATAQRNWAYARAWLFGQLDGA